MAYLALYRKLRPRSFDEVVGQRHITTTLMNQIKRGQVGHAYLFTGTRGVGKTTVARIFARSICCLEPVNGLPCGRCEACVSGERSMDIIELDGASNNGVDNIRDIRESVIYPPSVGKRKVYVIDEVHMLTGAAFNALLKTLEEPPEHVVFILCTTEVHKLPQTIMSRCMRFDFRFVRTEELYALLKKVFDDEKKEYEDAALYLIAENARGSVRDAMSLADRCMTISDGRLTYAEAADALGAGDSVTLRSLVRAILSNDAGKSVELLNEQLRSGINPSVLTCELGKYFRNLTVAATVKTPESVLKLPEGLLKPIIEDAGTASVERFLSCAETFSELEGSLRYSLSAELMLEAAVVRCALRADGVEVSERLSAVERRMERIEKELKSGFIAPSEGASDAVVGEPSSANSEGGKSEAVSFVGFTARDTERAWAKLTGSARRSGGLLFDVIKKVTKAEKVGQSLVLEIEPVIYELVGNDKQLKDSLLSLVKEYFGDAKLELKEGNMQTESEVMQKLKEITDGKLKVER